MRRSLAGVVSQSSALLLAAFLAATLLLLAPAVWNGFPFLFYDTGDYFARPLDGMLNNGRSMVYGVWLAALRYPFFWPVAIAQCALTVWTIYLVLRTHGLANRPVALPLALLGITLFLAALTALPWISGQLMPDLFAALAVLGVYLLLFKNAALGRFERYGVVALIAFSCASHNATLAVVLALLAAAAVVYFWRRGLVAGAGLLRTGAAVMLAVVMLLSANVVFAGKFAWTPGGAGFVFSRLVQDGIVQRYLADNCPHWTLKLCDVRWMIPDTADDFLWHQGEHGPFAYMGGFEDGAEEMTRITLDSIAQYPGMHVATALRSTAEQLVRVKTGDGIVHNVWHAYGVLERLAPEMHPASHTSLQRQNRLARTFTWLNYFHVPVTLGSMALLPLILLLAWRRGTMRDTDMLAATLVAALLANAFVTGALSNPNDRYGARLAWTAPLLLSVIFVQFLVTSRAWQAWAMQRLVALGLLPKPAAIPVRERRDD